MELLDQVFLNNNLLNWLIAIGIITLTIIVLGVAKRLFLKRVVTLVEKTETRLDNLVIHLVRQTQWFFILLIAIYLASLVLILPEEVRNVRNLFMLMAFLLQAGFWGNGVIVYWVSRQTQETLETDPSRVTTLNALGLIAKIVVWSVVILLILDNIPGVEVNTLIASLGIGGIAVALAVQNILGDLFASLSIMLDKPFVIGDSIIVGEYSGTVERIGLKSTRIRSVSGEQLIFSNSDLLSSRIRNFRQMESRRAVFSIGVTYQTPYEKLAKIPEMIRKIVESHDGATFDRAHFKEYGDFSLRYEVVYNLDTPDQTVLMDIQQSINLAIFERFEEEGIEFAYPTQTVFVAKEYSPVEPAQN